MMRVILNHLILVMLMVFLLMNWTPYASTPLININVLYAAAQAVELEDDEEMFTVTGGREGFGNKLRARVDGSFQKGTIDIQALSVSSDKTTFFSF